MDQFSWAVFQSNRPLAAVTCAFCLGIALSLSCPRYSFSGFVAADICLILSAFLSLCRKKMLLSYALGLAAISVGGLLTSFAYRDGFSESDLRSHLGRGTFRLGEPVSSEGCVVKESEPRGEDSVATIEFLAFLDQDCWRVAKGKAIIRVPGSGNSPHPEFTLMRGDRIRAWVTWNVPHNFENPGSSDSAGLLIRRGVFLVGRIKSQRLMEIIPAGCADPWTTLANAVGKRARRSLQSIGEGGNSQRAAILSSLVIGDYSGLGTNTREAFQNSGTFHVLVISGLHVAWIAGLLLQSLRLLRLPERARYMLAFLVILFYTCVVGFQASISRCLWMFLLYLIGRMLFRRAEPVNILLASALILLAVQPTWLLESGFQLSFVSVLAIAMTAAPLIQNFLNPVCRPVLFCGNPDRLFLEQGRWHRLGRRFRVRCEIFAEEIGDLFSPALSQTLLLAFRGSAALFQTIAAMMITSIAVQIWLQPLLACYFNRLSWISPLSNIVIVPLSSLVLATGTVAAFAIHVPCLGKLLMPAAGFLSTLLLSCAKLMSDIPGAWQRCPTPSGSWVLGGILLLFVWSFLEWRRFWIACAGIAVMLGCLSYGSVPVLGVLFDHTRNFFRDRKHEMWALDGAVLSITILDVGEGDSLVIRFPDARIWVLDAGGIRQAPSQEESAYVFDVGEAVVSRYLWHFWVKRVDRTLISHPDTDHAGGISAVLRNFSIDRFAHPRAEPNQIVSDLLTLAGSKGIRTEQLQAGMEERIGNVKVEALNPPATRLFRSTNENSLVLRLSLGKFAAFLAGDLEKSGEAEVLSYSGDLESRLLKVAHHGSRSGTTSAFLNRTKPRWAILSVGRNNPFGHPAQDTITRLLQHQARPLSTIENGAITFETDGRRYLLKSHVRGLLDRGEL